MTLIDKLDRWSNRYLPGFLHIPWIFVIAVALVAILFLVYLFDFTCWIVLPPDTAKKLRITAP